MLPTKSSSLKLISYLLILLLLFQSCTVYQRNSTSLAWAITNENNKAVIVTKDNINLYYTGIEIKDGFYNGIILYESDTIRMRIEKDTVDHIQLYFHFKVVTKDGRKQKYKGIILQDDQFYGITQVGRPNSKELLRWDQIESVHLVDVNKSLLLFFCGFVLPVILIVSFYVAATRAMDNVMSSLNFSP
jgi:hypothetical protein